MENDEIVVQVTKGSDTMIVQNNGKDIDIFVAEERMHLVLPEGWDVKKASDYAIKLIEVLPEIR